MITKNSKIVVLMGGPSTEAEISKKTGKAVADALLSLGYNVTPCEYIPDHVVEDLKRLSAEVVFIALHGKYGEDGTIQSVLELAKIPYTGSGVTSSAITMDKIVSSRIFKQAGLPMSKSQAYYLSEGIDAVEKEILNEFSFPVVLKPACEGSTDMHCRSYRSVLTPVSMTFIQNIQRAQPIISCRPISLLNFPA